MAPGQRPGSDEDPGGKGFSEREAALRGSRYLDCLRYIRLVPTPHTRTGHDPAKSLVTPSENYVNWNPIPNCLERSK